jgi:hypothetical protein
VLLGIYLTRRFGKVVRQFQPRFDNLEGTSHALIGQVQIRTSLDFTVWPGVCICMNRYAVDSGKGYLGGDFTRLQKKEFASVFFFFFPRVQA